MSRRELLAWVPAVAASAVLTACGRDGVQSLVDVRAYGAKGDGTTDDSRAIQAAAAALRSNSALYFPSGTYRFAQQHPRGDAAVVITGVSNVAVMFEPGAELLMDNIDPGSQTGTSHGLLIQGPASRITLQNIKIRWVAGAKRSLGDGIRVVGSPAYGGATAAGWTGRAAPVNGISVSHCDVTASPQAGVIMVGVSDITVTGLRVSDSGADGLHFNACRRAGIDDYSAVDTGDDGLALVTYFAGEFTFDTSARTFSFPDLNGWSNADFAISNVNVYRSKANGVRIAGAQRVTITGLRVFGARTGSAVMVDSAEPGTAVGWNYVASRVVRMDDLIASNCDIGIHLLARSGASGDRRFTDFDVEVRNAKLDNCGNWSVQAESLTEHKLTGFRTETCSIFSSSSAGGNGGVGIHNVERVSFDDVSIRHAKSVVVFEAVNAGQLSVDGLAVKIDTSEQSPSPPPPCVTFDRCRGVVNDMEIEWPAAPGSWLPVRLSPASQCAADLSQAPLALRRVQVKPPVSGSFVACL